VVDLWCCRWVFCGGSVVFCAVPPPCWARPAKQRNANTTYKTRNNKLSCRREAARCFVSLSLNVNHWNSIFLWIAIAYEFLLRLIISIAPFSIISTIKRYRPIDRKLLIFHTSCTRSPRYGGSRQNIAITSGIRKPRLVKLTDDEKKVWAYI